MAQGRQHTTKEADKRTPESGKGDSEKYSNQEQGMGQLVRWLSRKNGFFRGTGTESAPRTKEPCAGGWPLRGRTSTRTPGVLASDLGNWEGTGTGAQGKIPGEGVRGL